MKPTDLFGIAVVTVATVLSVYFWVDRWNKVEGFAPEITPNDIQKIIAANEPVPTDADAIAAHQTLLRYIRNDFDKGIKFVFDFRERFFGPNVPIRADFDPQTLMDNYMSPLQRK